MNLLNNLSMGVYMSAPDLSANTDNGTINNLANEILGVILIVLILVFSGKLIGMFQQRQYAQLIVLFLVGSFAFWFVMDPNSFITTMKGILDGIFT